MPATYEKIASTTLGSATTTISLSSIPATYTDIELVFYGIIASAGSEVGLRFNSDNGNSYSVVRLRGSGVTATSTKNNSDTIIPISVTTPSGIPTLCRVSIMNYTGSTFKSVLVSSSETYSGAGYVAKGCGLWRDVSIINSIQLIAGGANFQTGARVTIYGILKA